MRWLRARIRRGWSWWCTATFSSAFRGRGRPSCARLQSSRSLGIGRVSYYSQRPRPICVASALTTPRYGLWAEKIDHTITLEDVTVRHASADGIRLEKVEEEIRLDGVQVEAVGGVGIWVAGRGLTQISQAVLRANGRAGLWREGGYLSLRDSRFNANGSAVPEEANLVLGRGVSGEVTGNAFTDGIGIYCVETREVEIEDNTLANHEVGLWSKSARPRIVRNQFFRNALAPAGGGERGAGTAGFERRPSGRATDRQPNRSTVAGNQQLVGQRGRGLD